MNQPSSPTAEYMALAERALQAQHLSRPHEESALDYYQRVLALEPDHQGAREGLALVAERYADMAEAEMAELRFADARTYIERGLEVQPHDKRLRLLEEQARPVNAVPQRIESGIRTLFNRARRQGD